MGTPEPPTSTSSTTPTLTHYTFSGAFTYTFPDPKPLLVVEIAGVGPAIATVTLSAGELGATSAVLLVTTADGVIRGTGEGFCSTVTSHTACTIGFVIDGGDGRFTGATGTAVWRNFNHANLEGNESISGQFDIPA